MSKLDRVSMYRLMLIYVGGVLAWATVLAYLGFLPYSPAAIAGQTIFFVSVCYVFNRVLAGWFKVPANHESAVITGLILSAIAGPLALAGVWLPLLVMTGSAMVSKYLIAPGGAHIFNPAAFGVLVSALLIGHPASWWIGSVYTFPLVLVGGFLVLKKIRRLEMAGAFLVTYLGLLAVDFLIFQGQDRTFVTDVLAGSVVHSSLLFFAFVMLVEPLTSPNKPNRRLKFGWAVGLMAFAFQRFLSSIPYSFELALMIGNLLTRGLEPSWRRTLTFVRQEKIGPAIREFWFRPEQPFDFLPGQFVEYTLPHIGADGRGIRRYFTIASSPTESEILLATRISEPGSSFKKKLLALLPDESISASQVAGDFVLPAEKEQKLVFIAGGIGVTPFRSMAKFMLDKGEKRDIVLLYACREEADLAYRELFEETELGWRNVYILSDEEKVPAGWSGRTGMVNETVIKEEIGDWSERLFYVSGPEPMVEGVEKMLYQMGVPKSKVKRDYFPGYEE